MILKGGVVACYKTIKSRFVWCEWGLEEVWVGTKGRLRVCVLSSRFRLGFWLLEFLKRARVFFVVAGCLL